MGQANYEVPQVIEERKKEIRFLAAKFAEQAIEVIEAEEVKGLSMDDAFKDRCDFKQAFANQNKIDDLRCKARRPFVVTSQSRNGVQVARQGP